MQYFYIRLLKSYILAIFILDVFGPMYLVRCI
nr:MAG TPA: hypothetical protein [Caudoviricetes sp.]